MGKHTALYAKHLESNATLIEIGGWSMPSHYGSASQEHQAVRQHSGMFDVSHMTIVDVRGLDAEAYLQKLLANDVTRLADTGKALYSAMLNNNGGIIDDLIVYNMDGWYRVISNCITREQTLEWMTAQSKGFEVTLTDRPELVIIAIQGPDALSKVKSVCTEAAGLIDSLNPFQSQVKASWFYARTGYTGEEGLEVILPEEEAADFWQQLLDAGVTPCGLTAADTLRIEAGLNAYGKEMDESTSPLIANMRHTIAWQPEERHFFGREALEAELAAGIKLKLVGLILSTDDIMSAEQKVVIEGLGEGVITSAAFSPTLQSSIAIARVPNDTSEHCQVEIQGQLINAKVITLPFVRYGKQQF